ncbi:MAG: D-2-hydroxyacid dehydrogenase [Gemmatimonadales bacterium]|nr:D-2-hydroxyacid dehydrogenase [Gemmatimonadales bacterium]
MASPSPWFPKRILISHNLHEGLGEFLTARRPDLTVRALALADISAADVEWAEVMVGFRPPREGAWRDLRWIHCIGAGVDAFLFRTGLSPNTLLTRTSEDFGPQIGEYCLARALAVTQRLRLHDADQAAREWRPTHSERLAGTRVVVVGTGSVGQGIARAFRAVGCSVHGLSRSGNRHEPFDTVEPLDRFAAVLDGARWLILACPLTEESWHLLDRSKLEAASGAYLINVARGAVIDESVLPLALDQGWLSGAALDVFEREPLSPDSPLWPRRDVTISPHISGLTTIPGAAAGFLTSLAEVEAGCRPELTVEHQRGY